MAQVPISYFPSLETDPRCVHFAINFVSRLVSDPRSRRHRFRAHLGGGERGQEKAMDRTSNIDGKWNNNLFKVVLQLQKH